MSEYIVKIGFWLRAYDGFTGRARSTRVRALRTAGGWPIHQSRRYDMGFPAITESLPPGRSKKRFSYSRTTPKVDPKVLPQRFIDSLGRKV
jgi:hypothetical protein